MYLGMPSAFFVKPDHVRQEIDQVDGVEAPTVGVEVGKKHGCHDGVVKSARVLEIFVPDLVDGVVNEFDGHAFGGFKGGEVGETDIVVSLHARLDNGSGFVGNGHIVAGWAVHARWQGTPRAVG